MKRATIDQLPPDLRAWLVRQLCARGFTGYRESAEELSEKLRERGVSLRVSPSALQRFGSAIRRQIAQVEEAIVLASAIEDEEGRLLIGAARVAQASLFRELLRGNRKRDWAGFAAASRGLVQLSQAVAADEDLRRTLARRRGDEPRKGLSDEAVEMIKRRILGISSEPVALPRTASPFVAPEPRETIEAGQEGTSSRQDPPLPARTRPEVRDSTSEGVEAGRRGAMVVRVPRRRGSLF